MKALLLRPKAQRDLRSIGEYTIQRWGAHQAERYVSDLRATLEDLASGRRRGRPARVLDVGYEVERSGSHLIYYRLRHDRIDVVRILHERMDAGRHLPGSGR